MKNSKLGNLLAAVALVGVSSYSLAADTIKIAIVAPVTGPVVQYGDMVFAGALTAVDEINKAGGVNGAKLEGIKYDDMCDAKQGVAVANKIVSDGVKFVVGHTCSGPTQVATTIYDENEVVMITPSATAPEITGRGYTTVFRTIGLDNMQAPVAAAYVADKIKPKAVAVIHDKQQYGEGVATAFKQAIEGKGVKVVDFEGINVGDKDFSSLITKLKRDNVDFVYFGGYHPELGMLLRQSKEKGLNARFMGPEGAGNPELSAIAGDASEGLLVTLPRSVDGDDRNKAVVAAFKAKNIEAGGAFILPSYAAVQVFAQAIAQAKSTEPEEVAAAIHTGTFDTVLGDKISFDKKGDINGFQFAVYEWHKDGSKTLAQ